MKKIKKLLTIGLAVLLMLCMSISLVGCFRPRNVKMNKEYIFKEIIFEKSDDLIFADIAQFVPASPTVVGENSIDTIEEFENYIRDNIKSFTFEKEQNGEWVTIDARAKDSIKFVRTNDFGTHMIVKMDGEEKEYSTVTKGQHTHTSCPEIRFIGCYKEDKRKVAYSIELIDKFAILYIYELA